MRTTGSDSGAARLHTITVWLVVLAIFGVAAFDAISVMASRVSTENDAQSAAYAASSAWHNSHSIEMAYQAAVTTVAGNGETVLTKSFSIDADGTAHLVLRSRVHSILLNDIGPLKKYTITLEHGDANSIN
jgi:hypothetical protein